MFKRWPRKTQITETTITACARYLICQADNGDVVNLSRSEDTCSEFCPCPNDFMIIRNRQPLEREAIGLKHSSCGVEDRLYAYPIYPYLLINPKNVVGLHCKTRTLLSRSVSNEMHVLLGFIGVRAREAGMLELTDYSKTIVFRANAKFFGQASSQKWKKIFCKSEICCVSR